FSSMRIRRQRGACASRGGVACHSPASPSRKTYAFSLDGHELLRCTIACCGAHRRRQLGWLKVEWRVNMRNLLLVAATLVVASPTFAQSYDPSVGSGNIARTPSAAQTIYPRAAPPTVYRRPQGALAPLCPPAPPAASPRRAPSAAAQVPNYSGYPVYDEYGHYVGADPDPNIRFQLHRDADSIGGF